MGGGECKRYARLFLQVVAKRARSYDSLMTRARAFFALASCILIGSSLSCASSSQKADTGGREGETWTNVEQMVLPSLYYRRPESIPADPLVGPGGEDYRSQPLPDARLDCKPARALFSGKNPIDLEAVRSCLASIKKPVEAVYRLRKDYRPALVLEKDEKKTPPCLVSSLSEIPVPREIVFQSPQIDGSLACYASGIRPENDRPIPFRWIKHGWELGVQLPLEENPENVEQTRLLLLSWALRPFKTEAGDLFVVKVVPDSLCRICLGDDARYRDFSPSGMELWPLPADDDAEIDVPSKN